MQKEIEHAKRWIDRERVESTYKRDLKKRVEIVNSILDNMKNPGLCKIIESKMNEIIDKINKTRDIFEDPLDSELRILYWILYQVCSNQNEII